MDVLVTGGTGFIGRRLCEILVDRGQDVTALGRGDRPEDLPSDIGYVSGDVTEYETILPALEGRDAVVHLVSLSPLYTPPGGPEQHELVTVGGTRNVVRAMEAVGVDRLLFQSNLGADPDAATALLRAKGRAEEIVRSAELDWTMTRPSIVFGPGGEFIPFIKRLTTPYVTALPGGGRTRFQPIWVEDLVDMLAAALEGEEHVGELYKLGGPQVLTMAAVTKLAYQADDRPVTIVPVPMPLARVALTIAGVLPLIPFGPDQYQGLTLDNTTDRNDTGSLGYAVEDLSDLATYFSAEN